MNITPEARKALRTLRHNVRSEETSDAVAQAIVILDNAGFFAALDQAEPVRECDCTPTWVGHMPGCPGDPRG